MIRKRHLAAALTACGIALADQPPAAATPPIFEAAVQKYIMEHPEVILKSLTNFQLRQKQVAQERARQTVVAERENLVNDPTSPSAGSAKGVTVVEFFDYRCGYCRKVSGTVAKLLETNPNVRVVFKELPILGPDSMIASKASLAAHKQGAYLKFHAALFEAAEPVTIAFIERIAAGLGMDVAKLKADMNAPEIDQIIVHNSELAGKLQVRATPTFVIGGEVVAGAVDAERLDSLIKAEAATLRK